MTPSSRSCSLGMKPLAVAALLTALTVTGALVGPDHQSAPAFVQGPDGARRPNGAFIYLVDGGKDRVTDVIQSLTSLDRYFNGWARYPVVIFYPAVKPAADDTTGRAFIVSGDSTELTQSQMERIRAATVAPITFATVDFESYVDAQVLANAPPLLFNRWGVGYRHMCNFFAGPVAHHRALAGYRYYWRQDADSQLVEPLTTDPFFEMASHSWRYGYALSQCDWHGVTEGLPSTVSRVVGADALKERLPSEFSDDSCLRGMADPAHPDYVYNNRIIYNNFEIVDLEFMRSPAYGAIYAAVADAGGIFNDRWGDAPIRTLAVFALLPPDAVHRFSDVSYYHQGLYGPVITRLEVSGVVAAAMATVLVLACLRKRRGIAAVVSRLLCAVSAVFVVTSRTVSWCCCCGAAGATCTFSRLLDALCCLRVRASALTAAEALAICNGAFGSGAGAVIEAAAKGSGRAAGDTSGLRRVGGSGHMIASSVEDASAGFADTSCALSDDSGSSRGSSGADSGTGTPRKHSPPASPPASLATAAPTFASQAGSSGGSGSTAAASASTSAAGSSALQKAWALLRWLTPLPAIHYARCSDALNARELALAGTCATAAALQAAKSAAIEAAAASAAHSASAGSRAHGALAGKPLAPIKFDSRGVPHPVATAVDPAVPAPDANAAVIDAVVQAAASAAAAALPSRVASFGGLILGPLASLLRGCGVYVPAGGVALASVARWLLPLSSESVQRAASAQKLSATAAAAGAGAAPGRATVASAGAAASAASTMRRSQSDPNGTDWERRRRLSSDFLERSEAGALKPAEAATVAAAASTSGSRVGSSLIGIGAVSRRDRASSSAPGSRRGSFAGDEHTHTALPTIAEAQSSKSKSAGSSAAGAGGLELPTLATAGAAAAARASADAGGDVGEEDNARLLPPAPIVTSRGPADAESEAAAATAVAAMGRGSVSLAAIARIAASGAILGSSAANAAFLSPASTEADEGAGFIASEADADWGTASGTPSKPVTGGSRGTTASGVCRQRHSPGSTLAMAVAKVQGIRWLLMLLAIVITALVTSRDRIATATLPAVSPLRTTGCLPSDLDCLLAAHADARRRIIVTGGTTGMKDFLLNLFVSLKAVRASNLLVFALDAPAAEWLASHNVPAYWDPAPLAALPARLSGPDASAWLNRTSSGAGGAAASHAAAAAALASGLSVVAGEKTTTALKFGTDAYRAVTLRKNEMMLAVLARGYNPLFTDADTVWLRNPLDDVANGPEPLWGDEIGAPGREASTAGTAAGTAAGTGAAQASSQPPLAPAAGSAGAPRFSSLLGHRCAQLRLGDSLDLLGELERPGEVASRSDGCSVPGGYAYAPLGESFSGRPPARAAAGSGSAPPDASTAAAGAASSPAPSPLPLVPAAHLLVDLPAPPPEPLFAFDVKGMYGDAGGLDTGFWYARSTRAMIAHMRNVVAYQRTAAGLALPSDQENFNEMLKPWLPGHLAGQASLREWMLAREALLASPEGAKAGAAAPAGTASDGQPLPLLERPPLPLPFTASDVPESINSGTGLGPARVRVAFFEPLEVPNGCRLPEARRRGVDIVMVHANCHTGWFAKVTMLVQHGFWFARLWEDSHVVQLAVAGSLLLLLRLALARALIACGHADEVFVRAVKGAAR